MRFIALILFTLLAFTKLASAEFVGTLKLTPDGCQKTTYCWLAENFGYIDKNAIGWQADKGNKTDGASIPKWAQRFVGVPFTEEYLKAAVLHDHYSKSGRPVRGWFETQRMFHEVLLISGVSPKRAAVLYAGVLIGSGKWIIRMEGKECPTGQFCVNAVAEINTETETESYTEDAYKHSFEKMKAAIEAAEEMSAAQIEELARAERPNSIFLNNPSGVIRQGLDQWPWAISDR